MDNSARCNHKQYTQYLLRNLYYEDFKKKKNIFIYWETGQWIINRLKKRGLCIQNNTQEISSYFHRDHELKKNKRKRIVVWLCVKQQKQYMNALNPCINNNKK